jgi:hypothetical protein
VFSVVKQIQKRRFLEYFEEEETSEELDVLLSHIATFTGEFEREHTKHCEALEKKRLQEQQRLDQEAKKLEQEKRKQQLKAGPPRHSLHEKPLHRQRSSNQHGHDNKHGHSAKHRHTMGARPEELGLPSTPEEGQQDKTDVASATPRGQRAYFPQFVVDQLKTKPAPIENGGLGPRTASSRTLNPSSSTAAA